MTIKRYWFSSSVGILILGKCEKAMTISIRFDIQRKFSSILCVSLLLESSQLPLFSWKKTFRKIIKIDFCFRILTGQKCQKTFSINTNPGFQTHKAPTLQPCENFLRELNRQPSTKKRLIKDLNNCVGILIVLFLIHRDTRFHTSP